MTILRTGAALVGSIGLVLSLGAPASAGDARPFSGWASGEVQFVPAEACPQFGMRTVVEVIEGNARHLGHVSLSSVHCSAIGPIGPGTMTLVAANGDEVHLTYTGFAPPPAADFDVDVDATIVGGTGRFDGATGHAEMTGHVTFEGFQDPSWPITFEWTGSISY
jgi:hypothetical protein